MNAPASDDEKELLDAGKFGPFDADEPARAFAQLPKTTREWLTNLREEDIENLKEAQSVLHKIETAGWLIKWSFITAVTVAGGLTAIIAFWEKAKGVLR
jgi:hypothetical protein